MKILLRTVGTLALGLVLSTSASAQVGATFVLRSGEKVGGELVDMNARGLVANVGGSERAWSIGQVAVVDFVGGGNNFPSGEVNKTGSGHVLALRNGSVVVGQLTDIGGRSPLRITFNSGGSDRDYSSNEVARIYFARPSGSGSGSGSGSASGSLEPGRGEIRVPATSRWVSTGINVGQGQTVNIMTTGEVRLSSDPDDIATPAGSKKGRYANNSPLPSSLAGALIGRINNGPPFGIGDQPSFPSPGTGALYLAVNDDALNDNAGEFGVTITLQPLTRNRRR